MNDVGSHNLYDSFFPDFSRPPSGRRERKAWLREPPNNKKGCRYPAALEFQRAAVSSPAALSLFLGANQLVDSLLKTAGRPAPAAAGALIASRAFRALRMEMAISRFLSLVSKHLYHTSRHMSPQNRDRSPFSYEQLTMRPLSLLLGPLSFPCPIFISLPRPGL